MLCVDKSIIYDRETAYQYLASTLGTRFEADEFIELLGVDFELTGKLESARDAADEYERLCDAYHSCVCDAIDIIDDNLIKQRITNARRVLADVRNALEW